MELPSASVTAPAPSRAAHYVRMSTEHRQYSPENQLEIVRQYAAAHNMAIVQEYWDHGRTPPPPLPNVICGTYGPPADRIEKSKQGIYLSVSGNWFSLNCAAPIPHWNKIG
jgi:hypothetical protein